MISLGKVSGRTLAIYDRYYSDREADRFVNFVEIFEDLASIVAESDLGVSLEMDYLRLGEIVRSYFFDTIRYKEYHFDPKDPGDYEKPEDQEKVEALLREFSKARKTSIKGVADLDPLWPEWAQLVHECVRINKSKVAAYTVKWILRYKPISVIGVSREDTSTDGEKALPDIPVSSSLLTNINEEFAYLCALTALEIDAAKVPKKKQDELIYCFRFRNFDESSYFMILTEDYLCSQDEG